MKTFLIFDTETTGLPSKYNAPIREIENWPRMVELAMSLADDTGNVLCNESILIKPDGFVIPVEASNISGITTEYALENGVDLSVALESFRGMATFADAFVCHNLDFDIPILFAEAYRMGFPLPIREGFCTKLQTVDVLQIPNSSGYQSRYKWPRLKELHEFLFGEEHQGQHRAGSDADATRDCFFAMKTKSNCLDNPIRSRENMESWIGNIPDISTATKLSVRQNKNKNEGVKI